MSLANLVKQAVDIVDVVGHVVPLRRSGNRHIGLCPFHQEKTASFHVDAENQLYYCFGCNAGGDVINFVMRRQNLTFAEAIKYLAERYNIQLPRMDQDSPQAASATQREKQELYGVLESAAVFFYRQLHQGQAGRAARDYIKKRGLPEEVVERERLGYAPASWDGLAAHLRGLGAGPELGLKAGLLAQSANDPARFYDRFRNRLIFPITNENGKVVAFGGRSLSTDEINEPKYLNSPETPVYHKGRMLYQFARAREECRQVKQAVLVEGYMDLLAFHAKGFYRVVATLGTALTPHQVRLLSRFCEEVVLAYDGDEAGERAMIRGLPLFFQEELPVSCIRFPMGMDPDDFLKAEGLAGFEALVEKRRDLGEYTMENIVSAWDGSAAGKSGIFAELKPVFQAVRQPLRRAEYLKLISERLSVSEEIANAQLRHEKHGEGRPHWLKPAATLPALSETQSLEERIVRLMIKFPEVREECAVTDALAFFREPVLREIGEALTKQEAGSFGGASTAYDLLSNSDESRDLYTRFLLEPYDLEEPLVQLRDWMDALRKRELKRRRTDLEDALREAEKNGDALEARTILLQIRNLASASCNMGNTAENI